MSDKFDAYEYIGVIAPGAVVVFALTFVSPQMKQFIVSGGTTVGGLGFYLILSFIAGHLLQGLGNWFEKVFWNFFSGMPTSRVKAKNQTLLAAEQRVLLATKISELYPEIVDLEQLEEKEWYAITRELYTIIESAGRSSRIDAFNRNYGLLRGVGVSFLITTLGSFFFMGLTGWKITVVLAFCSILAIYRMHRFGILYARELFVQYLRVETN